MQTSARKAAGGASRLISKAERLSRKKITFRRSDFPLGTESTNLKQATLELPISKATLNVPEMLVSEQLNDGKGTSEPILNPRRETLSLIKDTVPKKKGVKRDPSRKVTLSISQVEETISMDLKMQLMAGQKTESFTSCISHLLAGIFEDFNNTDMLECLPAQKRPRLLCTGESLDPASPQELLEYAQVDDGQRMPRITPSGGMDTPGITQLYSPSSTPPSSPLGICLSY